MVPQGRANQAAAPSLWQPLPSFPTRQLSPYPGKHPISRSGSLATYPATAPLPTPASTPFPEEEAHLPTYQPTYPATRVEAHLPTRQLLPYLPGKHPISPPRGKPPYPASTPFVLQKRPSLPGNLSLTMDPFCHSNSLGPARLPSNKPFLARNLSELPGNEQAERRLASVNTSSVTLLAIPTHSFHLCQT